MMGMNHFSAAYLARQWGELSSFLRPLHRVLCSSFLRVIPRVSKHGGVVDTSTSFCRCIPLIGFLMTFSPFIRLIFSNAAFVTFLANTISGIELSIRFVCPVFVAFHTPPYDTLTNEGIIS